jgi:dipeptidyl aminopeptidase/acylaminoacyl peptidase
MLFLGLSLLSFWLAVRPPRLVIRLDPQDFKLQVEPVTITATDGVQLAAWIVPRRGAPAVVLLHGYPAEKRDLLPLAAALAPHFTVVLPDLRFFGESGGRATTLGFRERTDLRRLLDHLETHGLHRVGIFGFSLGGAVALLAAAEDARIRAVAAYAPFADLETLAHDLYAHYWILRPPLVALLRTWARLFLGADITRPSPADAASRLKIPVLLIHSRDDDEIPFHHAERLQQALAKNAAAEFDLTGAGRHGVLDGRLEHRVADFFLRTL